VAAVTGFPHPISIARAVCDRAAAARDAGRRRGGTLPDEAGLERGPTLTDDARRLWRDGLTAAGIEAAQDRLGPGEGVYRRRVSELLGAANWRSAPSPPGRVLLALAGSGDPGWACAEALRQTLDLPDEFRSTLQALCLTPDGRHGGASTAAGASYSVITAEDSGYRIEPRSQVPESVALTSSLSGSGHQGYAVNAIRKAASVRNPPRRIALARNGVRPALGQASIWDEDHARAGLRGGGPGGADV
jgi:hypothetical protein